MPSPYQEFVAKARERAAAEKGRSVLSAGTGGGMVFTKHSEYKMRQYRLSAQKVRGVIRNPKRREVGIMPKTIAVMQPVSIKKENGKEVWKQEIWVMYIENSQPTTNNQQKKVPTTYNLQPHTYKIISAWRYPGVSPKRDPIPADILQELLNEDV